MTHFVGLHLQPATVFVVIILCCFLVEMGIMLVLSRAPWLSGWHLALLDGAVLATVLVPVLYYLLFLPLKQRISEQEYTQKQLQTLLTELFHAKEQAEAVSVRLTEQDARLRSITATLNALIHSESYFRTLFESSRDAVMLLDEHGFFDCNAATLAVFGCASREEFCRLHPSDLSPAVQPQGVASLTLANQHIATALADGSSCFEWIHRRMDGQDFSAEVLLSLVILDGRKVLLAVVRDITDRKRAEEELRRAKEQAEAVTLDLMGQEAHLRSILENAQDAIITTDLHGRVVAFNPAAERLFGFTWEEMSGQYIVDYIIPPDFREQHRDAIARWAESPTEFFSLARRLEMPGLHANGRIIDLQFSVTAVTSMGERYFTSFIQDVTERKKLLESLQETIRVAESSNRAKSEFLANMSHEIRTPMNGVLGMIDLTLETDLSDRARDFLLHAKSSSRLLLRVINDILDYSKIESGKLPMESVTFYLGDVLADAANLFRQTAFDKNLELVIIAQPQSIGQLVGDRLRIQQILVNLVGNAIKFTQEGSICIKVGVVEQTDQKVLLEFSVQDTGIGMTEAQIAQLFSPFMQADSSTTRQFGGTGLGLSICRRLAEMMGGEIWVSSTLTVGSTFHFTVPLELNQQVVPSRPVLPEELHGLRALVVDDNLDTRVIVSEILIYLGMDATAVESGSECLKAMLAAAQQGVPYALILVDWRMPEMDGIETAQKIMAEPLLNTHAVIDRPKVILMTAFGREEVIQYAQQAGVDTCLLKPMSPSLLLNAILGVFNKTVTQVYDSRVEWVDKAKVIRWVGGAHVLLVEDNPINQRVAQEVLEGVGIVVTLANHGQEAIDLVQRRQFELVFMDVQMPVMDGYQATKQLRAMEPFQELPIVAMTAHALVGDKAICLAAGMSDYITKPIDMRELFRVLLQWIKPREKAMDVAVVLNRSAMQGGPFLVDLPGINVSAALSRLGNNARLLHDLLLAFHRKYVGAVEQIRAALSGQRPDELQSVKILVHTIKGTAGNLSAEQLFLVAKDLEQAIHPGQGETWRCRLEAFEQAMAQVLQSIQTLMPDGTQTVTEERADEKARMTDSEVESHIRKLYSMLCEGHIGAVKVFADLMPVLQTDPVRQEVACLEVCLGQYDFDGALPYLVVIAKDRDIHLEHGEDT